MDINYLGKTNFRNTSHLFGIKKNDRQKHTYIIGKSGTGKSTLMKNMIVQDIQAGRGVAVIDPHGDLAQDLLGYIPNHRIPQTIFFNPADLENPIGFNLLRNVPRENRPQVASGVLSAFVNIWPDAWGARATHIFYNCLAALLDNETETLLGVVRLLADEEYRKRVVNKVKDPLVRNVWQDEIGKWDKRFMNEAFSPIQNKVGQFLAHPALRNILGQVKSTINFKRIMDEGYIFIADLSKGKIGEDKANLLGSLLVSQFQLTAMERVLIKESERRDFYLYIDEFQNFTTTGFDSILSEARKYRLCLILAHQYLEQLEDTTKGAIFGNTGTVIAFRVGSRDAQEISHEFEGIFDQNDCTVLEKYNIYIKLMIDGQTSRPFSAETLPVLFPKAGLTDKVIRVSRERYAKKRDKIEEKINRFLGRDLDAYLQK